MFRISLFASVFSGCLPTLATIPVFWGLYRTLNNVANEGLLTEGFFWIPSLSGPITVAQQKAGGNPPPPPFSQTCKKYVG
jgi:hypothetical protein